MSWLSDMAYVFHELRREFGNYLASFGIAWLACWVLISWILPGDVYGASTVLAAALCGMAAALIADALISY